MTKFEFQGTGRTVGPDLSGFIQLAAIIGIAVILVMVIVEYAALIITGAVILGIARGWFIYRQVLANRDIAVAGERMRAEQRSLELAALARRERHELAVAAASAPQVNITIDPAAILATAVTAPVQPQPWPQRQQAPVIVSSAAEDPSPRRRLTAAKPPLIRRAGSRTGKARSPGRGSPRDQPGYGAGTPGGRPPRTSRELGESDVEDGEVSW